MDTFEVPALLSQLSESGKLYLEFLRVPALSTGLYVLDAGATDPQKPHSEDEVYYIISGQGRITVGQAECALKAGSVVYVKADEPHFFHNISEKLVILVLFAPAEYTQQT